MRGLLIGVLGAVLLFSLVACRNSPTPPSPADREGGKLAVTEIPLDLVYSTSFQKGLKRIDDEDFSDKGLLPDLYRRALSAGPSNVFLVRGNADEVQAAVGATWEVFRFWQSVETPVSQGKLKSDQFWLVAYFGVAGSDGPAWVVKSVQIKGKQLRLVYTPGTADSHDLHPYFVWVPLRKLEEGTYTLELVNGEKQETTLLRRVSIGAD